MTFDAASIMARLNDRLEAAVAEAAGQAKEKAEALQSVPVAFVGGVLIRSKPGQPPRRETGRLRRGHRVRIQRDSDRVIATISNATPYARALEYGTGRMAARPTYGPVADAVTPLVVRLVRAAVSEI